MKTTESVVKEPVRKTYEYLKAILQNIKEDNATEEDCRTFGFLSDSFRGKPVWHSRKAAIESLIHPFLMRRVGISNMIEYHHLNKKTYNYAQGKIFVIIEGENLLKAFEVTFPELLSESNIH